MSRDGTRAAVLNNQQLASFLRIAMQHRLGPALWLTAMTGMRRGEVIALRWSDVDIDACRLSVRRSATCTGYRVHVTPTKTPTSRRTIDVDEGTVAVLVQWRAVQAAELTSDGAPHVFTDNSGRMLHPHLLSQTFERLQVRAGLPRIRLHDLRHTHATLLLKEGVPAKVVSERLGHANVAFTMAVYKHVLPGIQRDAATLFARLVTGDGHMVPVDGP